MKIIYLGYAVSEYEAFINKATSIPANEMALGIIEGLYQEFKEDFFILSIIPMQMFPYNKELFKKSGKISLTEKIIGDSIFYINLPFLKQITCIISVILYLFNLINKIDSEEDIVIVSVNSNAVLSIPTLFINKFRAIKKVCYLSDMPFEARIPKSIIKKIGILIDNFIRIYSLKKYDAIISFVESKYTENHMHTLLIDHIYDEESYKKALLPLNQKTKQINIVYTGSLNSYYQIDKLLEVMKYLPHNYFIHFYGKGNKIDLILLEGQNDYRIKYGGFIPPKDSINIQRNADILISLLDTNEKISKYAIPSKIVGYLATGVPVITSNAESIPKKYLDYLNIVDDNNAEIIAKKIEEIIKEKEVYQEKAIVAREFMLNECSWSKQVEKIINFIKVLGEKNECYK